MALFNVWATRLTTEASKGSGGAPKLRMQLRRRRARGAAAAAVDPSARDGHNATAAAASIELTHGQLDPSQQLTLERVAVHPLSSGAAFRSNGNGRRAGRSRALQLYQNPAMLAGVSERLIGVYRHQAAVLKRVMARRRRTEDLMEELLQLQQKRQQLQDEIDYAIQHTQALYRFVGIVSQHSDGISSARVVQDDEQPNNCVS